MTVLLFISMIIVFLGVDFVVQRKKQIAPVPAEARRPFSTPRVPSGIFFAPSHTWLTLFPSGNVRIGIDDFILRMMHTPAIVPLKEAGMSIRKGEPLFQLKEGEQALTARSPIDADIVAMNDRIQDQPEVLKEALFSDGWAYTLKPKKVSDLNGMLLGEKSRAWVQQEVGRLRDFLAGFAPNAALSPALLQDGGMPVEGALKSMTDEQCKQFEQQFLGME
ncbi:MAG TPA: hypothetical protein VMM58_11760 [Bacteroidota bacterium]|nr:hypothetical protein [Bacteroidota bacterium]